MRRCLPRLVCLPLCLFLLGCSKDPTAPVSGSVTYKGQSLSVGKVSFIDAKGRAGYGPIKDGRYSIRAPIGDCKVSIESTEAEVPEDPKQRKQGRPGMFIPKSFIPEKYGSPEKSGLTFKVEDKENTAGFALKD